MNNFQSVPNGQSTTGKDSEKAVILNVSYHFFGILKTKLRTAERQNYSNLEIHC